MDETRTARGKRSVAKKSGTKKKKKERAEEHPFVKLSSRLQEAEAACRAKFQSVSGFEITRKREDDPEKSFQDLMTELTALEEEMVAMLNGLEVAEVGDLVDSIISLLEAGSVNFFGGTRGKVAGTLVNTAARRALCRKSWDDDDDDDESKDGSGSCTRRTTSSEAGESGAGKENGGAAAEKVTEKGVEKPAEKSPPSDQHTIGDLVNAYVDAGLVILCPQLWRPARDGQHEVLAKLLAGKPWTVDEPGGAGQGYTSALQVACAAGHVECVQLLLKAGAIFRDADWQVGIARPPSPTPTPCPCPAPMHLMALSLLTPTFTPMPNRQVPPKPFVCTSMLTGGGYYDAGGAPRGILYFQSASLPKRRVHRQTYIYILNLLLESATFCEGQTDIDMVSNTKFAMENVEPPPAAEDVTILPIADVARLKLPTPPPVAPRGGVSGATPRYGVSGATPRAGGVSGATPRVGSGYGVSGATPRAGAVSGATPRVGSGYGVSGATPRVGAGYGVSGATPRVGGATPRTGSTPHYMMGFGSDPVATAVGGKTPRDGAVGKSTPRERRSNSPRRGGASPSKGVASATPRNGVRPLSAPPSKGVGRATPRA